MYVSVRCAAKDINTGLSSSTWDLAPCTPGLLPSPYIEHVTCSSFPPGTNCYEFNVVNTSDVSTVRVKVYRTGLLSDTIWFYKGPYPASNTYGNLAPGGKQLVSYGAGGVPNHIFIKARFVDQNGWNRISSPTHQMILQTTS
jgi:hypothetical protein